MTLLNLNVKTLLFLLFLGNLMTALFFVNYNLDQNKNPNFFDRIFFLGKLSQSFAWLIILYRGIIPEIFSLFMGNFLLSTGLLEEFFALVTLTRIKIKRWKESFIVISIFIGFLCLGTVTGESLRTYLGLLSLSHAILFLLVGGAFLMAPQETSRLTKIMGTLYALLGSGLAIRAIALLHSNQKYHLFQPENLQLMAILFFFMIMFAGNLGYNLVKKSNSDKELLYMATHDPLTNCFNKLAFKEAFIKFYALEKRQKGSISLIMLDIDHFKKVNDVYGHLEGDRVLKKLVKVIEKTLRTYDVLGRYGGEEFTVLLPSTDLHAANLVAERIRKEVEIHFPSDNNEPIKMTISLGVSACCTQEEEMSFENLLGFCDKALYKAKRNGRNQVVLFSENEKKITSALLPC